MGKTSHKDIEYQTILAKAVALRLAKTPYDEIIEILGHWNSISACQKAVATYLKNNQTKIVEDSRAEAIALLEDLIFKLKAKFKIGKSVLIACEIHMHRRRYIAGMQVEVDEETGKKINPFKPDDDMLIADDAETKFGEFTDAELEPMIKVLETAVKAISIVSGIPPAHFNLESVGNAISGDALEKIEARFISIIQDAQRSFGETYGEAIALGLAMESTANDNLEIEIQWTDAAPRSETEILDNGIKKLHLGWSVEQIQRDMGLSDEQITKMLEENEKRETAKIDREQKFRKNSEKDF